MKDRLCSHFLLCKSYLSKTSTCPAWTTCRHLLITEPETNCQSSVDSYRSTGIVLNTFWSDVGFIVNQQQALFTDFAWGKERLTVNMSSKLSQVVSLIGFWQKNFESLLSHFFRLGTIPSHVPGNHY